MGLQDVELCRSGLPEASGHKIPPMGREESRVLGFRFEKLDFAVAPWRRSGKRRAQKEQEKRENSNVMTFHEIEGTHGWVSIADVLQTTVFRHGSVMPEDIIDSVACNDAKPNQRYHRQQVHDDQFVRLKIHLRIALTELVTEPPMGGCLPSVPTFCGVELSFFGGFIWINFPAPPLQR